MADNLYGMNMGDLLCKGLQKGALLQFKNCFIHSIQWDYNYRVASVNLILNATEYNLFFEEKEKACNFRKIVLYNKTITQGNSKLSPRGIKCLITKSHYKLG